MHLSTNVVSSIPLHVDVGSGEVYSIQLYVIKFGRLFFFRKTDRDDITAILLNVSLSTITHVDVH